MVVIGVRLIRAVALLHTRLAADVVVRLVVHAAFYANEQVANATVD